MESTATENTRGNPGPSSWGHTKGKCVNCKVVWHWPAGKLRLKDARCPNCHRALRQTTHLMRAFRWQLLPAQYYQKGGTMEHKAEAKCGCGQTLINGVCINHPTPHAIRGSIIWPGMEPGQQPDKFYRMGWLQGFHHVEIWVFTGKGVRVHYLMTGLTYSWAWEHKEEAWTYARDKDFHIQEMKAAGNLYAQQRYARA